MNINHFSLITAQAIDQASCFIQFSTLFPDWANIIIIRLKPSASIQEELAKVDAVFRKYNPAAIKAALRNPVSSLRSE